MRSTGHAEHVDRLDELHAKLMATAAEVSAFVASSQVNESALELERRTAQRDQVEAEIAVLDEEKESLQAEVDALKAEREAMIAQKMRAATELSSVHTALDIRREELHLMESKAEAIERRMLEGVMNQSRMLLLGKSRPQSPTKRPQGRDLRLASNTSSISAMTTSTMPPLQANHALAVKSRPVRNSQASPGAERRIMSLSQINHNLPTGLSAYQPSTGLLSSGVKRSHSVKTGILRKPSWAGSGKKRSLSGYNKENETLSEEDEEDEDFQSVAGRDDFTSDAGTERRGSEQDSRLSYAQSYDGSSYMTGSELEGRESLGSVITSDHHVAESEASMGALQLEAPPASKAIYAPPSDSGIGTDLPTAMMSASEHGGFFK